MPRITRKNSIQQVEVKVESSPDKDDCMVERKQSVLASTLPSQTNSQCIMIAPVSMLEKNKAVGIVQLRNPRTATGNLYAFSHDDSRIYEVNQFDDSKRSWFVDNSVQSDGALFLTSIIDPLFLIIPYLFKAKHASPLDQVLVDEEYPAVQRLLHAAKKEQIEKIADCKKSEIYEAWKFNEDKVMIWLEKKVSTLSSYLKDKHFNVTQSAVSANYVKSTSVSVPESTYMRYAFGMISEYLSEELAVLLEKHLDLPAIPKPTSCDEIKEPPNKRQKLGDGKPLEPLEDYSKEHSHQAAKEKTPTSAKAKALASAAKGSKSISSFFGKK